MTTILRKKAPISGTPVSVPWFEQQRLDSLRAPFFPVPLDHYLIGRAFMVTASNLDAPFRVSCVSSQNASPDGALITLQ